MKKLVAAACVCMAATGFAQVRPAPVVGVEKPVIVKEGEPKSYVGVLKASERVSVTAQVAGKIWRQNFREGGHVEKGQALFEIEDTVYKANLATAKANLRRLEAQLVLAEKEVARYKRALEKKGVSENDYDRAVNARDVTLADIETAKAQIALAENDMVYTKVLSSNRGYRRTSASSSRESTRSSTDRASSQSRGRPCSPLYSSSGRSSRPSSRSSS